MPQKKKGTSKSKAKGYKTPWYSQPVKKPKHID